MDWSKIFEALSDSFIQLIAVVLYLLYLLISLPFRPLLRNTPPPLWQTIVLILIVVSIVAVLAVVLIVFIIVTSLRKSQQQATTQHESSNKPKQLQEIKINNRCFRIMFQENFNLEDLRTLCFDLEVQSEIIGTDPGLYHIRVIEYFQKRGRLHDLIDHCRAERTHINWNEFSGESHSKKP